MPVALHRDIRKTLEGVVRDARVAAEAGARIALRELGVADAKRPAWLTPPQIDLRKRLRAHARSLGDPLDTNDAARLPRLIREIAYAHWHRALFARFLLENGLLVDVDAGNAPVRPAELREIADAEGRDVAEVAAEFAAPMLPEIFPKDDPVLALTLPPEARQKLAQLVDGLPAQTFKADDSLGWTYQFWQADRKKQVNESEVKIGADELPAVTQLFTEDYMVLFLLENTLGAWWAGRKLAENPGLARSAADEDELRRKLSLPEYQWTYLRFVRNEDGLWRPAAGMFPGWPKTAAETTVLDPCMGSGHFLVFALAILVAFRKAEEGLDEDTAVTAVLRENLYGLEIDPRCTQIAAFALALTAWKRIGGVKRLPRLNLACSGLSIGMGKAEFVKLAERMAEADGFAGGAADLLGRERNPMEERALSRRRGGLERLYDLFAQAPVLGSLIDPRRALGDGTLFEEGFDGLAGMIGKVLDRAGGDPDLREAAVTAQGLAKAAELLSQRFTLVATNVPYLGNRRQSRILRNFAESHYRKSKSCLSTIMIERLVSQNSAESISVLSPQAWLQQPSYKQFLQSVVFPRGLHIVLRYGPGAFDTITGEVVSVSACILPTYKDGGEHVIALDLSRVDGAGHKSAHSITAELNRLDVRAMKSKGTFLFQTLSDAPELAEIAIGSQGVKTGGDEKFVFKFWEFDEALDHWRPYLGTSQDGRDYSGRSSMLRWGRDGDELIRSRRDSVALGRKGIALNQMGSIIAFLYTGESFDSNVATVVPKNDSHVTAVYSYLRSKEFLDDLSRIEGGMKVNNGTVFRVPFDLGQWQRIGAECFPSGLPKPYSNDPSQWLFDGHPRGSANPNRLGPAGNPTRPGLAEHPLQVAVARLLGYRWPRQTGSSFMECPAITEPDEIDRSGRVDPDGIVCLASLHGEPPAAERLRGILQAAWGAGWGEGVVRACLEAEGTSNDLDTWLAGEFFDGHCKLFHQTPFIWHVWDGVRGGFSTLVNYHKLCAPNGEGRRLLEKLRDTYLGEWIAGQRRLVADGDATAEDRLVAAEHLAGELTKIIEGQPPYDIFVRWKPLHQQPVGWEPDIDDGVRLNIRPFLTARPRNARRANACILRVTPGVKKHAGADRGGEPHRDKAEFPWFWAEDHDVATLDFAGGPAFKGRRYNDFHYTRHAKQAARSAKGPDTQAAE